jgi:hypothetical protein
VGKGSRNDLRGVTYLLVRAGRLHGAIVHHEDAVHVRQILQLMCCQHSRHSLQLPHNALEESIRQPHAHEKAI